MQTAKINKDKSGWKVIVPLAIKLGEEDVPAGVETFGNDADKCYNRCNALNEAYEAAANASAVSSGPAIEVLSADGRPIEGWTTTAATDSVVFADKDGKATTEKDLVRKYGTLLVQRQGGKVQAAFRASRDFDRYMPVSPQGLAAIRRLFSQQ